MVVIKSLDYVAAGKVFAVLGGIEGLVVGLLSFLGLSALGSVAGGVLGLVLSIIFGLIGGLVGGLILALLYNFIVVKVVQLEGN